jgi:hypothetical protein
MCSDEPDAVPAFPMGNVKFDNRNAGTTVPGGCNESSKGGIFHA